MARGLIKRDEKNIQDPFVNFRNEMERVFDDFFSLRPTELFDSEWVPSIDVDEDEKNVYVRAEIPGIEEKDIDVTLEENILTISGEKKEEHEEKDKKHWLRESRFGSFQRSVALPEGIKAESAKAKFKKGVLDIEIEKTEKSKPKSIKIDVK